MVRRYVDWFSAITLLAAVVVTFLLPWFGRLEGRLFPVVADTHLFSPSLFEEGTHKWGATSRKLRDCRPLLNDQGSYVTWWFGSRAGGKVRVAATFGDPPAVRDKGTIWWQDLRISLDPVSVTDNSHADVIHQCPWRPWKTVTRFYDANDRVQSEEDDP